jgi:hypothetical protein
MFRQRICGEIAPDSVSDSRRKPARSLPLCVLHSGDHEGHAYAGPAPARLYARALRPDLVPCAAVAWGNPTRLHDPSSTWSRFQPWPAGCVGRAGWWHFAADACRWSARTCRCECTDALFVVNAVLPAGGTRYLPYSTCPVSRWSSYRRHLSAISRADRDGSGPPSTAR